jgi:hypothetical protein
MADGGFEVEVEDLRTAAKSFLGAAIDDLATSKSELDSTKDHDYSFDGGANLFAEVRERWEEMRHYFDRVFDDNIENLVLAQGALLEIANRYEEMDNASARAFQE